MSDSLNAILVLSYFPCLDFPGLLICDGEAFEECIQPNSILLQILKVWASNQANITKLDMVLSKGNRVLEFD